MIQNIIQWSAVVVIYSFLKNCIYLSGDLAPTNTEVEN